MVVAIFDDAGTLEEALELLGKAGLDDEVQKLEGGSGSGTAGAAGASEGGSEPLDMARSPGLVAPWPGTLRAGERPRLGGRELDEEESSYYQRVVAEGARLVLVEVPAERSQEAAQLLQQAGASRVQQHD